MKSSSVLFTELDRRLSVSNNNQNNRKYKEENKKCRKNRHTNKEMFDKGARSKALLTIHVVGQLLSSSSDVTTQKKSQIIC